MMIGIRLHDLKVGTLEEVKEAILKQGFEAIQLVFKKALKDQNGNPLFFSEETAIMVSTILKDNNLEVAMLGAYFNPVHSNKKLVKENCDYFVEHLKYGKILNCQYVGSETGSFNDDKWTYNPKNRTIEGYNESLNVFKYLVKKAEEYNSIVLMEPAYGHVMYDAKTLAKALKEIDSPHVCATIDLYNLLYIGNYKKYKEIFVEALELLKDKIKIVHLKDFYIENNALKQCGLGDGILDFNFIIENIKKIIPDVTLIFEGVIGDDIEKSLKYIKTLM